MVRNTLPLLRVRGIAVRVHVSWLVVFALVTWSLALGFLPEAIPGIAPIEAWLIGGVSAILLFASVLTRDLAHSFVALRRGLPVHSITLFLFGGVSNLSGGSKEPPTEFLVRVVGPLTSLGIAAAAFLVALLPLDPRLGVVASYLAIVNVLLGSFNLISGFPLDGGRVSAPSSGRPPGASAEPPRSPHPSDSSSASGSSRGVSSASSTRICSAGYGPLRSGSSSRMPRHPASSLAVEQRLGAVRVRDAFIGDATAAGSGLNLSDLIEDHILLRKQRAVLVVEDGRLVGIVTVGDLQKVARDRWPSATAAEAMTPADRLITIAPAATLRQAAGVLSQHEFDQLPVVDDGGVLGVITRADIMREFQIRDALDIGQGAKVPPATVAGELQRAEG